MKMEPDSTRTLASADSRHCCTWVCKEIHKTENEPAYTSQQLLLPFRADSRCQHGMQEVGSFTRASPPASTYVKKKSLPA
jgi:hypothetical protein